MDVFTKEKRSDVMSRIRGSDTKLEVSVRRYLHRLGFRFRKNDRRYPGKPDIILPRYRAAIQIHGCFWHSHSGCKLAVVPKTRTDFWIAKLNRNVEVDNRNEQMLREAGWRVRVIWECHLERDFDAEMDGLVTWLRGLRG